MTTQILTRTPEVSLSTQAMMINHIVYKATGAEKTLQMAWDLVKAFPKVANALLDNPEDFVITIEDDALVVSKVGDSKELALWTLNVTLVLIALAFSSLCFEYDHFAISGAVAVGAVFFGYLNNRELEKFRNTLKKPLHTGQMAV